MLIFGSSDLLIPFFGPICQGLGGEPDDEQPGSSSGVGRNLHPIDMLNVNFCIICPESVPSRIATNQNRRRMPSRRLTTAERHDHILKRVSSVSGVDYESLAKHLKVSVMTVRRDVRELSKLGYLKVTRGGATAQLTHAQDLILNPRILDQNLDKTEIAKYATSLIGFGETIFLGTGSTCALFAQFLPSNEQILVLTPSLPHAILLASRGVKVIILGGTVATDDVAASGMIAAETLNRFTPNRAIIGCAGISQGNGISEFHQEIADINRLAIEKSESTSVLTDSSKFGIKSTFRVSDLKLINNVVTSKNGAETLKRSLGVKVKILFPEE